MHLSNYPPGVTGNEPQIVGGDDPAFLLPNGDAVPEIRVVIHEGGDSVTVTAEAAWNLGRLVVTAGAAYRVISDQSTKVCESPSTLREDEPGVWTFRACGACRICRLRRDIEACGGMV
mgnify:CR=1 FL=1